MFPIIVTLHLTIGKEQPKEKAKVIIVMENTTLQISCILLTSSKLRRSSRSAQIVGVVANSMVDAVADAKVTAKSGETIRRLGI